jgi:DNA (cytosine-5)-methyltransferase 1
MKMRGLSLFTGYAGIDLALLDYVDPIAYVEIEEYAQKIIAHRMADGSIPRASLLADVKNVEGKIGICDIIYGGFPCQNLSVSGHGDGIYGDRSILFFEVIRLAKEIQPSFIFLENVPAIRTRGLEEVVKALAEIRYDCRWLCLSASEVGANHKRERWFPLAHANSDGNIQEITGSDGKTGEVPELDREKNSTAGEPSGTNNEKRGHALCGHEISDSDSGELREQQGRRRGQSGNRTSESEYDGDQESVADSDGARLERFGELRSDRAKRQQAHWRVGDSCLDSGEMWWKFEPPIHRVVNGTSLGLDEIIPTTKEFRKERIKACGNGVVPLQVRKAFEILMGLDDYLSPAEDLL